MGSIKKGITSILDIKKGITNINYVYKGITLIWQRVTPAGGIKWKTSGLNTVLNIDTSKYITSGLNTNFK